LNKDGLHVIFSKELPSKKALRYWYPYKKTKLSRIEKKKRLCCIDNVRTPNKNEPNMIESGNKNNNSLIILMSISSPYNALRNHCIDI
jgi:hypothetical protein